MRKEQQTLRILGDKVRYYRKLKGLSQAELAANICTQATISLIEKRNKVPSMNILMRLISRLEIQLDDIVVEHHDRIQQLLNAIDYQIQHHQYAVAADNLSKIRLDKIKSEDDQKRYYYYQGIIELFKNNAPDEAIYFFGRVLSPLVNSERDLYAILATLGLGLAYADKHTFDRSRVYIDQALRMLKHVPLSDSKYLDVELTIYWHIARVYYELSDFKAVLKYTDHGIREAVKHDKLFLLDELYTLQARALKLLGNPEAPKSYQIAIAFAQVTGSTALAASLAAEMVTQKPNSETA
ncbi:XRE family transcriptional regulator [Lacticaseibacillus zeae DSM 20178 = KCTC 3804]|uniref:Helix-turn-helix transcriptional regulator n=2 Tax=Lacticaseibacillus zeae TaxID=57037 RepID=A0A5R8M251_LACZE|nr:helix-turn-helix transcriptional regulator [Lacticaseibacillus zeae]KRK12565.1 XRE family transcriptional regulator [Lacticaseibacillus zeae DSM 20178 = KCTC 3804]OLS04334.1 XRE family transcriptional regulator [Lacticaseibacillus casei]QVI33087.1 helix-turn-helix transcriptional regulator [Lacticaseibacillus zeae]TLF43676.1 helix-turn-helix transcriptional regulator [Lacticaseibacillus zeae]